MEFLRDLFILLGRVFIGGIFLWAAYDKIKHWHHTMNYMKSRHVPQLNIVMPIAMALKIIGGLLVVLGWHAHIGALLLLIVAVPSTVWLYPFWKLPHGEEHDLEKALFRKEVAIVGGLLLILALGAGPFGFGGGG